MDYVGESLAIGILTMDSEGYDQMMVMHGTIEERASKLYFEAENSESFEMSENWLKRLKPVESSMDSRFHGAKHALIVGTVSKN